MQFPDPAAAVADSISSLDKDVVNEVRRITHILSSIFNQTCVSLMSWWTVRSAVSQCCIGCDTHIHVAVAMMWGRCCWMWRRAPSCAAPTSGTATRRFFFAHMLTPLKSLKLSHIDTSLHQVKSLTDSCGDQSACMGSPPELSRPFSSCPDSHLLCFSRNLTGRASWSRSCARTS